MCALKILLNISVLLISSQLNETWKDPKGKGKRLQQILWRNFVHEPSEQALCSVAIDGGRDTCQRVTKFPFLNQ